MKEREKERERERRRERERECVSLKDDMQGTPICNLNIEISFSYLTILLVVIKKWFCFAAKLILLKV